VRDARLSPPAPRIHDLRHTAAALAIATGAHPKAIQERLGHASITTTLDRYGHLMPGMDEQIAERLEAMAHHEILDAVATNTAPLVLRPRCAVEACGRPTRRRSGLCDACDAYTRKNGEPPPVDVVIARNRREFERSS
jgi:hypothetical protein